MGGGHGKALIIKNSAHSYMRIRQRIYEDYFKRSRLARYGELLSVAKKAGYKMLGISAFYDLVVSGVLEDNCTELLLINRHDIDTSPKIARKLFEIEKTVYGKAASATYYFRNSTIDVELIHEIEEYGYETGYHYEEIAEYMKAKKTRSKKSIQDDMREIQLRFLHNLENFREKTGSKSITVASHGDWINTKLEIDNLEILQNQSIRQLAKIRVEAYDEIIMKCVHERYADQDLLEQFPHDVINSIDRRCRCIMILTHPRNWAVDYVCTTRENVKRLKESIKYQYGKEKSE